MACSLMEWAVSALAECEDVTEGTDTSVCQSQLPELAGDDPVPLPTATFMASLVGLQSVWERVFTPQELAPATNEGFFFSFFQES